MDAYYGVLDLMQAGDAAYKHAMTFRARRPSPEEARAWEAVQEAYLKAAELLKAAAQAAEDYAGHAHWCAAQVWDKAYEADEVYPDLNPPEEEDLWVAEVRENLRYQESLSCREDWEDEACDRACERSR